MNTPMTLYWADLWAACVPLQQATTIPVMDQDWISVHGQMPLRGMATHSQQVQPGELFIALMGSGSAERLGEFIHQAIANGAALILSDTHITQSWAVPVIYIENITTILGDITQAFYAGMGGSPLAIAAVTGTNGKTTITRLIAEIVTHAQQPCVVMGTTGNGIYPQLSPSSHTTLDAVSLQTHLYRYAQAGAKYAALEASSHGLAQHRLTGLPIRVAIFSNLTRDHLDYHGTLEAYQNEKAKLFQFSDLSRAIVNSDDAAHVHMLGQLSPHTTVWRYSLQDTKADFAVLFARYHMTGVTLSINTPYGPQQVESPLLGAFNVYNLLAAMAGALAMGMPFDAVCQAIPKLVGAPGRMQVTLHQERLFVVDYAHTPDALTQVLTALRIHARGRLICVFGCGGDRDRGKRPLMTRAVLADADIAIITADNPRFEAVDAIIDDMCREVSASQRHNMIVVFDRRQAIAHAMDMAVAGDIVVIAGKGHEDYQEIAGVRYPFSDVAVVEALLAQLP